MALAEEDIRFIKKHLQEWLAEEGTSQPTVAYEIEIREVVIFADFNKKTANLSLFNRLLPCEKLSFNLRPPRLCGNY